MPGVSWTRTHPQPTLQNPQHTRSTPHPLTQLQPTSIATHQLPGLAMCRQGNGCGYPGGKRRASTHRGDGAAGLQAWGCHAEVNGLQRLGRRELHTREEHWHASHTHRRSGRLVTWMTVKSVAGPQLSTSATTAQRRDGKGKKRGAQNPRTDRGDGRANVGPAQGQVEEGTWNDVTRT